MGSNQTASGHVTFPTTAGEAREETKTKLASQKEKTGKGIEPHHRGTGIKHLSVRILYTLHSEYLRLIEQQTRLITKVRSFNKKCFQSTKSAENMPPWHVLTNSAPVRLVASFRQRLSHQHGPRSKFSTRVYRV